MIHSIKKFIFKQQFNPNYFGMLLNPFYFARKSLRVEVGNLAPNLHGKVLDVGCGTKPYRELFRCDEYVGLEIDSEQSRTNKQADFYYDGMTFPFCDASFDGVICNQVLEHVFTPDIFLSEIKRVLKVDGKLLLTVPFVWDEHEQPYDYARYSSFGLKSLLEKNGLEILEHKKTNGDARVLFQLLNAYLYKSLLTSNAKLNLLVCLLVMAPVNVIGVVLSRVLPKNPDLYLDHVVLAKKMIVATNV